MRSRKVSAPLEKSIVCVVSTPGAEAHTASPLASAIEPAADRLLRLSRGASGEGDG